MYVPVNSETDKSDAVVRKLQENAELISGSANDREIKELILEAFDAGVTAGKAAAYSYVDQADELMRREEK